jgi:drug/metabolite transporter (DMT)-like permease
VPYLMFLAICAIWGGSFILMKKASLCYTPVTIGAWRVIGGAAVLGAIWGLRRLSATKGRISVDRKWLRPFSIVVVLGFLWPYCIQPYLITRDGSAFVAMTVAFNPLFTIFVSLPLLGIQPTPRQMIGVGGALVCMAILMADGLTRQIPLSHILLGLSVPFGYAVSNVVIRGWLKEIPALDLTLAALSVSLLILGPLALLVPADAEPRLDQWWVATTCMLALGVFGTGLAMYWFNLLIKTQGPLFAGMVTNLVPLGAVFWGWMDSETVTVAQIGAVLGVLSMVTLVQYGSASPTSVSVRPATVARD